jgi:UDP-N-acetylmuramoyl-L-alanyl-D-glutamate--2,6-diaminopimelate ligase
VFTTLGRDHLDYHHTPEAYLGAKLRLFDLLEAGAGAVVNADHPAIVEALRARGMPMLTFSARGNNADLTVVDSRIDLEGTELEVRHGGIRRIIRSPLLGLFQVENLACAAATGLALGLRLEDAADALGTVRHIPGRFQPVAVDGRVWAAVDYAHTPGALERALQSARTVARGRVVVVFGCGGDRDQGKRPLMGAIASRLADVAIVTSDNPRSEDPDAIIRQITAGADGPAALIVESNRRAALALAAGLAQYGDLVLVAGKGHETTQTIGDRISPFSDAEELSTLRPAGESTQGKR